MTPRKLLVTGATGFIGGRLCERLTLEHRIPYRALVRNFTRAARIARLDAEMLPGDLLDAEALALALDGCDAVIHLAHSNDRTAARETSNLITACRRAGVQRFVHISSMAVHGPSPRREILTERTAEIRRWGEPYSDAKARSEAVVSAAIRRRAFPAIILRPTVVYGPYSGFVTPIVEDARQGRVSTIDGGRGLCNAVYVDDVCDAIIAAVDNDRAVGGTFFVNGDSRITWGDFIQTFARLPGLPTRTYDHTAAQIREHWRERRPSITSNVRAMARLAAAPSLHAELSTVPALGALLQTTKELLARTISEEQKLVLKRRLQRPSPADLRAPSGGGIEVPSENRVVREAYRAWISNSLAKTTLGWSPRTRFEQGAQLTAEWLRFARMI